MKIKSHLFFIALVCLVACKKNDHKSSPGIVNQFLEKTISVTDHGVLKFASASDYRKIIEEFNSQQKQEVIDYIDNLGNYRSLKQARKSTSKQTFRVDSSTGCNPIPDSVLEDNPMVGTMLNSDGVFQVGSYMYKANWDLNSVFAMGSSKAGTNYGDLINCTEKTDIIGKFPMDVDVIDYTDNGFLTYPGDDYQTDSTGRLFCFKKGASAHWGDDHIGYDDWIECDLRWMKLKVEYLKLGFYFRLYTNWKGQTSGGLGYITMPTGRGTRDWDAIYSYSYRVKCGGSSSGSGHIHAPGSGDDKIDVTAYESSRGLASYSMCADFDIKCYYLLKYPPQGFCKTMQPPTRYLVYSTVIGHQNCITSP